MNTTISVLITLVLVHGPVVCPGNGDNKPIYDGCFNETTRTLTINTEAINLRDVLLEEVAHAKWNKNSETQKLFKDVPRRRKQDINAYERMAGWFILWW